MTHARWPHRAAASILLSLAWPLAGGTGALAAQAAPGSEAGPVDILGPPPPVAPAVITRDETGNATILAFRVEEPIDIDGELSEEAYRRIPSITGFIQSLPDEGAAPTERTEVWILFDDGNIYVSARNWDSAPESDWVANEMRRDTNQLRQNQTFGVMFDTFYDRRNGVMFYTNPLGALAEFQMTNEGNPNSDWNPIWDVRTGRFDGGWTVEMEIPFQSLRYRPGREQIWGVQLRRAIRRKNEWNFLTFLPRSVAGTGAAGSFRVSMAGTLVGIEVPPVGRDLEVKPYVISGLESDFSVDPRISNDGYADAGLDVKYGITENLTADFTFNTDFAQVEVDEQQVNLTRFNLFFPEKREFFLEGRGIFDFAPSISGGAGGGGGNGGPGQGLRVLRLSSTAGGSGSRGGDRSRSSGAAASRGRSDPSMWVRSVSRPTIWARTSSPRTSVYSGSGVTSWPAATSAYSFRTGRSRWRPMGRTRPTGSMAPSPSSRT